MASRTVGVALLCAAASLGSAAGCVHAAERVIASAGVRDASGAAGRDVEAAWVEAENGRVTTFSVAHSDIEQSYWSLFRFGMARTRSRMSLSGSVDLGPALVDGDRFTYRKAFFDAAYAFRERWTVN